MSQSDNLRQRLARDLAAAHEDLDALVSRFDLGERQGVTGFLLMHEAALSAIPAASASAAAAVAIGDLLRRARVDLTAIGVPPMPAERDLDRRFQPVAVDYVLGGSRLGAEVLRRRWQSQPAARAALGAAYMGAPRHLDIWNEFCRTARAIPADTDFADTVVRDAAEIFALFRASAEKALEEIGRNAHAE